MIAVALALLQGVAAAPAPDFHAADSIVRSGIERGIYPGAVLILGRRDGLLHARGFGRLAWPPASPAPTPDSTLWDLASLTKAMATAPSVLRLVEQGRVGLDQPVTGYLPRFAGPGKERVTLRMLLNHTSGLPSYREFFRLAPSRDSALSLLYATPLRRPAGGVAEYSDLNFMLLGLVVEAVGGEPLDRFAAREIFGPAGLRGARFHPGDSLAARTAPTGRWRGHPVCCVVNDQNAVRLGGVAGHAGLFATGEDVARYARLWLGEGTLDGRAVLQPATVRAALDPGNGAGDRLLGWERPSYTEEMRAGDSGARRPDSPYGHRLSTRAYGHTGWTGTLLWVDPARDLFLVLLTNRSYAPRMRGSIAALRAVRSALADAVVEELDRR